MFCVPESVKMYSRFMNGERARNVVVVNTRTPMIVAGQQTYRV